MTIFIMLGVRLFISVHFRMEWKFPLFFCGEELSLRNTRLLQASFLMCVRVLFHFGISRGVYFGNACLVYFFVVFVLFGEHIKRQPGLWIIDTVYSVSVSKYIKYFYFANSRRILNSWNQTQLDVIVWSFQNWRFFVGVFFLFKYFYEYLIYYANIVLHIT